MHCAAVRCSGAECSEGLKSGAEATGHGKLVSGRLTRGSAPARPRLTWMLLRRGRARPPRRLGPHPPRPLLPHPRRRPSPAPPWAARRARPAAPPPRHRRPSPSASSRTRRPPPAPRAGQTRGPRPGRPRWAGRRAPLPASWAAAGAGCAPARRAMHVCHTCEVQGCGRRRARLTATLPLLMRGACGAAWLRACCRRGPGDPGSAALCCGSRNNCRTLCVQRMMASRRTRHGTDAKRLGPGAATPIVRMTRWASTCRQCGWPSHALPHARQRRRRAP